MYLHYISPKEFNDLSLFRNLEAESTLKYRLVVSNQLNFILVNLLHRFQRVKNIFWYEIRKFINVENTPVCRI